MSRQYDHYMILTQSEPRKVFVLASEQGYTVPEWEPESNVWIQLAARVTNTFVTEQLGLPVILLQTQLGTIVKNNGRKIKAYFLEGLEPYWQIPEDGLWAGLYELANLNLVVPELKPHLESWLAGPQPDIVGKPPAPEWMQPGWLFGVNRWVEEKLATRGVQLTGLPEQLKTWSISCLLCFPTDHGNYFFKAIPQVFKKEPFFTAFLAEHFPGQIPDLEAIDSERGWMLMPDFRATNLRDIDDIALWEEAARRYAQMQIASINLSATLLEKGCRDRRLDRLGDQLAAVVADTAWLVPNKEAGLDPTELGKLNDLVPVLKARIAELDSLGLPVTLIHGDLNSNNIAINEMGQFIYYDWTDLSISHPFFDLDALFEWGSPFEETIPDWDKRIRHAYLEAWTGYMPEEKLMRALELSIPLAIMVQALNYYWIVTKTDKSGSDDFDDSVPYHFRRLLEAMA